MKRAFPLFSLAVFGLIIFGSVARAQEATGKIVGTIYDEQGAVIPGAKVTVSNTATGVTSTGVTNNEGYFEVPSLPIGTYNVTVEQPGFVKVVTQAKKLEINQTLRFNITLKIGAPTQTVTVEAQVSGVETENPTIGNSVIGNEVQNAPLNGRDVLDLALLQPGVTGLNSNAGGTMNFNIAGGRNDSITYLLDGGMNNDLLDNGVVYNPNPDSIAEFRILTSNYTAEYGRNGGGIISEVTKSGTNSIHGSAFEYNRNGDYNANRFFNNLNGIPRDTLRRNQFGGTVGGPITIPHIVNGRDKLFFFVGYQGQRQTDAQQEPQITTFTNAEANGDFSHAISNGQVVPLVFSNGTFTCANGAGCPDPNVVTFLQNNPFFASNAAQAIIDPTKINVVAKNVFAAGFIPLEPVPAAGGSGLVTSVSNATDNNNELTGKVDYALSSTDKLAFTVGGRRSADVNPFAHAHVNGFPDRTTDNSYFGGASYTKTFSASLLNEFHINFQRHNILQDTPAVSLPTPAQLGFGITPDLATGPPDMDFDNGLRLGFSIQGPSNLVGNTYVYSDVLSWIKGNNTWKFGGGFSAYQQNMVFDFQGNGQFFFDDFGGAGTGNSFADFFLGIPDSFAQSPNAPTNVRQKTTYAFVQDEWHVRKNLQLTLGLRYEYSSPKLDTEGRTFSIIPGKQSTVFTNAPLGLVFPGDSGVPAGVNFPDKDNFAPRIGFAWDPTGNGKTSIRGGAGIFYDVLKAEDNFQFNGQPPFFSAVNPSFSQVGPGQNTPVAYLTSPYASAGINDPFPSKPPTKNLDFGAAGFLPYAPSGGVFDDPHLHTPYTYQYNVSVEHQLAPNLIAEINYVGSSSKGLTSLVDINPFILGTTNRVLNPPALAASPLINSECQAFANAVGLANPAAECPFPISEGFQNISFASFNSLESSLTKHVGDNRYIGNTYFTLGYTYGRSVDNASGFRATSSTVPAYSHSQFRGPSDFDATHRIVFSGGWDLPFASAWSSGPKRLLAGWSLYPIFTWQTGFPLTVNAALSGSSRRPGPSGAGDGFLANAAFNPGFASVTTLNPKLPGNVYFDPATFTSVLPANEPYGLPRGIFRGPGMTNLDMSLVKRTQIYENLNLELRLDAFNVFNHAEFQNPDLGITSGTFGQVTDTFDPRIVQIAARLTF